MAKKARMRVLDPDDFEIVEDGPARAPAASALPSGAARQRVLNAADFEVVDEEAEKPGMLASFGRGVLQGATFGFADEIAGAVESAVTDKTYEKARDESRGAFRAAQQANPWSYGIGEVGAGVATTFVPGLGLAKGAGLLANAGKAAVLSGVAGLGASEEKELGGQLVDAGKSAFVGGAAAGIVGRVMRGAPARVEKRLIGNITDGATATQRDRLVGKAGSKVGDVLEAIKGNKAIVKAGNDPQRVLAAVEDEITSVGSKLDDIYAKAGGASPGIEVQGLVGRLGKLRAELAKDPGKRDVARAVQGKIDDIAEAWSERTHVSPQEVRVLARDIGDAAFRGSPAVTPKQGQQITQKVWGELRSMIDEHIESVGKKVPGVDLGHMRTLNKQMSTLINMRDAVAYRATRESTTPTTLTSRLGGALDIGLAFTDPTSFVAKKGWDFVGKPAVHAADRKLAELMQAAQRGERGAQLKLRAVQLGISSATAEAIDTWATNKLGGGFEASER
jgi:hypothetical protein